ncbi:MAG: hypothetical protein AABO41_22155 [Acidobacteriota bacterium]
MHDLGNKLIGLAEHSYAFRQMETLQQVSQMLLALPLPRHHELGGRYYQALCIQRLGAGDIERAARLLEGVAERASPRYRVRAMISLGADSFYARDYQSALSRYHEADRFASLSGSYDPYATVHTQKMIAVINSEDGNHRGALALLENLFPIAHAMRSVQPHVYFDYMNSLAVELCEVGRLEEARNASKIVLASPFAAAYPEWRETREEIELRGWRASRSTVAQTHAGAVFQSGAVSRNAVGSSNHAGQPEVVAEAALATTVSEARNQPHDDDPVGNAGTATTEVVSETSNILTLPRRRRSFSAAEGSTGSQALARVIEFPSRTTSMSDENDEELDIYQKRRFIADKLYGMFMDTLEGKDVDLDLVEKLWNAYVKARKTR